MREQLETPRDQSLNQPLNNLEGAKVEDRPINRLLKIHEAAKLELQDLKADFQIRLQESILQTEEKLKQRFADEQEQRIKQTEEEVRNATTQELLARFDIDFQKLRSEFEEREKNAIAAAEKAAELRVKEALGEAERAKEGVETDFQIRLQESVLQTEENLKQRFAEEQEQKIKQTQEAVRNATTQELQARFHTDFQKLSSEFEERERNAIAATENAAELRLKEVRDEVERFKDDLEEDFQSRLKESLLQKEENLKQRFAEEQEQKIKQTEEEVRNATTQELLERFDIDSQKLSSEFEEKERNAIAAAENAAELRLREALTEAERDKERAKEGLEADFQIRLQESILQTEENLKQRFAEEQEQKIKQTQEEVRQATTQELLERFDLDFQKLSSEFEEREKNGIAAAENAVELRLKEVLGEAQRFKADLEASFQTRLQESVLQTEEKLKQRFTDEQEQKIKQTEEHVREATTRELLTRFEVDFQKFESAAEKWDLERQQLHHEITRLAELEMELSEVRQEKARLEEELRAAQVLETMSPEFEAKLEQVRGEKARLEEELGEANARLNAQDQRSETTQAARVDTRDVSDAVKAEIERIESRGREISVKIADPSTDLPTQIRFNRERTELEAYLKGLHYSLGEITFDK